MASIFSLGTPGILPAWYALFVRQFESHLPSQAALIDFYVKTPDDEKYRLKRYDSDLLSSCVFY